METASEIVNEVLKRRRTGAIGPEKHERENIRSFYKKILL
jgi:hypothetical protein